MQLVPSYVTKDFGLLCFSSFLFFMNFNMIIPELYDYITLLGGAEYKGLVLFLFTLTSGISRPFSGKFVDIIGRIPVMVFGAAISCIASALYPLAVTVTLFLWLRVFHGLAAGFYPTGNAAMVSDIVPSHRRGEAMGFLGFLGSLGMAIGPFLGSYIKQEWGYTVMFLSSSFVGFLAVVTILMIQETKKATVYKKNWELFLIKKADFFEPSVWKPTIVFFLYAISFGGTYTLIPDFTKYLGIDNKGWFFGVSILFSIIMRLTAGRWSDTKGRQPVLRYGITFIVLSMLVLASAHNLWLLILGSALFGMGHGINSPTIFAWTTDLSKSTHRGRAFSTMFIGMEAGIGLGAIAVSEVYHNYAPYFKYAFLLMAVCSSLAYFFLRKSTSLSLNQD